MKRKSKLILTAVVLCTLMCLSAVLACASELTPPAEETDVQISLPVAEETRDSSTPRLMATSYTVQNGFVSPGEEASISVVFKNTNEKKSVKNLKLSFSESSGEIIPIGMGTCFIKEISAGGEYTWAFGVSASYNSLSGEHTACVSAEYESDGGGSYTAADTLRIPVRQTVELTYDGAVLPEKATAGDTVTLNINLMNTGKSTLSNVRLSFDVSGLRSAVTTFAGTVPAGESKSVSANLNVDEGTLGEVSGSMKIYYDDDFGEPHELTAELFTNIEKKVTAAESTPSEKEKKYPLWWLFLLTGTLLGAALGAGISVSIQAHRQRVIDEQTL